jgi:type IV pilus assembly protein PilN
MIRINLLPYREKEKKEDLTRQIVIIALAFVGFLLIIGSVHLYFFMSIGTLEKNIKIQEDKLAALTKIIGDIEVYKNDKAILEKKLAVINNLEENRLAPVRMLDELTTGTDITIEGMARSNIAVAHFMKNLSGSTFIKSVDLVSTKEKEISGVKLQQFVISCVKKKGL